MQRFILRNTLGLTTLLLASGAFAQTTATTPTTNPTSGTASNSTTATAPAGSTATTSATATTDAMSAATTGTTVAPPVAPPVSAVGTTQDPASSYQPSATGSNTSGAGSPLARPTFLQPGTTPSGRPEGFSFGSYGRVAAGSDLRGRVGGPTNIVAHGTRIDEQTYAELELKRDDNFGAIHTRIVATLGITGPIFHDSGQFDLKAAVRNLYIEEQDAFVKGLAIWAGSRMYRGDDIYLLNWWPLDNLNTVGGGARLNVGNQFTFAAHVGANRLDTQYQHQQIRVPALDSPGGITINILDRPRIIGSLKATWFPFGREARAGMKISLYGEAHGIPSGTRRNLDTNMDENLPDDVGFVVGGQVGLWTGVRSSFVNLFFRYGQGLGAYGDLSVPFTLSASRNSARARDVVLALAGNWEHEWFGIMGAAYVRYFRDADAAVYGRSELWEGTIVARPTAWIGQHFGISAEASFQAVLRNMINPRTGNGGAATMWRFAIIPHITPAGRGHFTRPHIRLIYAVSVRNEDALAQYASDDPLSKNALDHYLAINCEWWFNSSYL